MAKISDDTAALVAAHLTDTLVRSGFLKAVDGGQAVTDLLSAHRDFFERLTAPDADPSGYNIDAFL